MGIVNFRQYQLSLEVLNPVVLYGNGGLTATKKQTNPIFQSPGASFASNSGIVLFRIFRDACERVMSCTG